MKKFLITLGLLSLLLGIVIIRTDCFLEISSRVHNRVGYFYLQRWKWDKAIIEFKKALENHNYSHQEFAYYNLGEVYYKKKAYGMSLQAYKKALECREDFKEVADRVIFLEEILLSKGENS